MNDEEILVEVKAYTQRNIIRAGEISHISQRESLRQAYRDVRRSSSVKEILDSIEGAYHKAPYERSLKPGWPNQKYALRAIYSLVENYAADLYEPDDRFLKLYYTGYPEGFYGEYDGSECEEREIEMGESYEGLNR